MRAFLCLCKIEADIIIKMTDKDAKQTDRRIVSKSGKINRVNEWREQKCIQIGFYSARI